MSSLNYPLYSTYLVNLIVTVSTFVASYLTGNCSFIDKLWSILPVLYSFIYSLYIFSEYSSAGFTHDLTLIYKTVIMLGLVLVWGSRLTYNFYRKGGYTLAHEDYRWEPVRNFFKQYKLIEPLFQVFNFFFISLFQSHLLWGLTLPYHFVYLQFISHSQTPPQFNLLDFAGLLGFTLFFIIEVVADRQQFIFQQKKYELLDKHNNDSAKLQGDFKSGFLTQGLFKYSRHPNFLAEQAMWVIFSLFGASSYFQLSLQGYHEYLIAPTILVLLFQGSTWLTELLTLKKHPEYQLYQRKTGRFFPNLLSSTYEIIQSKKMKSN